MESFGAALLTFDVLPKMLLDVGACDDEVLSVPNKLLLPALLEAGVPKLPNTELGCPD